MTQKVVAAGLASWSGGDNDDRKLIVRGPDAGEFLDRLYPNRFSNLKPERVRYGVIASDAGRIMDDGTICRLDDDTYYVTTTSSGAGAGRWPGGATMSLMWL